MEGYPCVRRNKKEMASSEIRIKAVVVWFLPFSRRKLLLVLLLVIGK
jgi:hypothetical protein